MANVTRRGFLKSASIGGMTIVLAGVPGIASSIEEAHAQTPQANGTARGPIVAYVHDTSRDEVSIMVGTRKVVIRDRKLVAQLQRAAR